MYLDIDLGMSELTAMLVDAGQRPVATARSELSVEQQRPLWPAMLAPRFARFRELYRTLRPLFSDHRAP
jgi:hypothetical protein